MAKVGRRPKFNPKKAAEFLEILVATGTVEDAAVKVGLDDSTIYRWVATGRAAKRQNKFREFSDGYRKAQAERDLRREAKVERAGDKDWRALAWLMAVSNPRKYSLKLQQHIANEYISAMTRLRAAYRARRKPMTPEEALEVALTALVSQESAVEVPHGEDPHLGEVP